MPHCMIEYSQSLESLLTTDALLKAVYHGVDTAELFKASHIRVRALAYQHYLLGGECHDFIHVTVRLHQGRNPDQKKQLSESVLAGLQTLGLRSVSITVELVEMDTASYARCIES